MRVPSRSPAGVWAGPKAGEIRLSPAAGAGRKAAPGSRHNPRRDSDLGAGLFSTHPSKSMIQPIAIRFAVYTLAIFGFTFALPLTLNEGDHAVFHEDGPIEWAQFLCLGLAAAEVNFSPLKC